MRRHAAVGNDQYLAWTGDTVDSHVTEDLPLGRGDMGTAGTHDLVHSADRLGTECQCRYRLRPADGKYFVHADHVQRRQEVGIPFSVRRRHRHRDLANARHPRRNHRHQDRRRVRGLPAGHVYTDTIKGHDALTQPIAQTVVEFERAALFELSFVVVPNAPGGIGESPAIGFGQALPAFGKRPRVEAQGSDIGRHDTIESGRVLDHGGIAARAHILEHPGNRTFDLAHCRAIPMDEPVQRVVEVAGCRVQAAHADHRRQPTGRRRLWCGW